MISINFIKSKKSSGTFLSPPSFLPFFHSPPVFKSPSSCCFEKCQLSTSSEPSWGFFQPANFMNIQSSISFKALLSAPVCVFDKLSIFFWALEASRYPFCLFSLCYHIFEWFLSSFFVLLLLLLLLLLCLRSGCRLCVRHESVRTLAAGKPWMGRKATSLV